MAIFLEQLATWYFLNFKKVDQAADSKEDVCSDSGIGPQLHPEGDARLEIFSKHRESHAGFQKRHVSVRKKK